MVETLFENGAVAVCAPTSITEGTVPQAKWHPSFNDIDLLDEYMLVVLRADRLEFEHKPDALMGRADHYGAWAILPLPDVGAAVTVLLAPLMEMTGSKYPKITAEPVTRDELITMQSRSGER